MIELLINYKLIDLTHPLHESVPTWDGDCGFKAHSSISKAEGLNFNLKKVELRLGTGTHMDAPFHCFERGLSIEQISLNHCIAPLCVINAKKITPSYLLNIKDIYEHERENGKILKGSFVIFATGWSKHWKNSSVYRGEVGNTLIFPSVSEEAALLLLERDIVGLGVDTLSPDLPNSTFAVHRHILGANKYIIENIFLSEALPSTGATICALPLSIERGSESPIRLIAFVPREPPEF